jgi:hypothetical protein
MVTNMVQSQLGGEDFSKMLRESGQDMGKLIQKILGPMAEPLKQSFSEIAKNLDERAKQFSDGLAELANRTRATGELMDKANAAQASATRNALQIAVRRRLINEDASDNASLAMSMQLNQGRQERLTGFGGAAAQSPEAIANAMGGVFDSIKKAEAQITAATKEGDLAGQNAAAVQLTNLKTRAADLSQSLKNLTDVSERTAAAQEKLGKIQADREGRQQLGIRYATANVEGRAEIARSFSLIQQAARIGTAAPFSVRDQNQIFSMLSSLSPQMRLQGAGGSTVKELTNQLLKTTFGGAFDLDPQAAAMERALENFVQQNYETAARAAQIQVDIQQKLQNDFFGKLQSNQSTFLTELQAAMAENQRMLGLSLKMQAQTRLADLEKKVGQGSMLGKIGVTTDEQFKAVSDALKMKDSPIEKIFSAGQAQSQANRQSDSAIAGSDRFTKDLIGSFGQTSARGLSKSDAAASIMSQFAEMGFSSESDRNTLLKSFSKNMDLRVDRGATIENSRGAIAASFREAVRSLTSEKVAKSENEIGEGRNALLKAGMIPKEIIDNITKTATTEGGDLTLASIREAVTSVDSTNRKFSELNKTLAETRMQVQGFVEGAKPKPAGGLIEARAGGGEIRFFNKGGWGSGGSTTPHPSDTVNARIAPNEFVVSAGPAAKNRALLEHLNKGGRVGFAEGGPVDEAKKNAGIARDVFSSAGGVLNPTQTAEAVEQAKKLAFASGYVEFLAQLKGRTPEDREKFISTQMSTLDTLKKKNAGLTDGQTGVEFALGRIAELQAKREKAKKNIADARGALGEANIAQYHGDKRALAVGEAFTTTPFPVENKIVDVRVGMEETIRKGNEAAARQANFNNLVSQQTGKTFDDLIKNTPALNKHAFLLNKGLMVNKVHNMAGVSVLESLGDRWVEADGRQGTRYRAVEAMIQEIKEKNGSGWETAEQVLSFGLVDYDRTHEISDLDLNNYLRKTIYGGRAANLIRGFAANAMNSLADTKPEVLANDADGWFMKNLANKNDVGFNYEREIQSLIDLAIERAKSLKDDAQKIRGVQEAGAKIRAERTSAFATPQDRLKELAKVQPEDFNAKTQMDIMKAQGLQMEVEAFNKLNPALQARLLEDAKTRILENKLKPAEQAQLDAMGLGKALGNTSEVTAAEIEGYNSSRPKMTLLQRAALDVLMKVLGGNLDEKAKKDPDTLSGPEKAIYLARVDAEGQTAALARINDRANFANMNRLGRFLAANPGLIESRRSAAEDLGPAGYAEEVALLEILAASFGTPTSLKKASEIFKDRSLRSKAQAERIAAEAAAAPPPPPKADEPKAELPPMVGIQDIGNAPVKPEEPKKKFASGGLVPGTGNTDSVRANLPVGSYVIKKSSVQKFGAENLAALPHLAGGGVVPAMVMPGEHIFSPEEAARIGKGNLDRINQNGRLQKFAGGGAAEKKAIAASAFGLGVPVAGQQFVMMPVNQSRWSGQQTGVPVMGFMPQSTTTAAQNPVASASPYDADQNAAMAQFQSIQNANNMLADTDITALKAKYFSLRNDLRNPRNRTKDKIDEFRQLHATLSNPMIAQMDAQRQLAGAQEALSSFQQDPKAFMQKAAELRKTFANTKLSMQERIAAKEQYDQMNYAARSLPPGVLRGAMMQSRPQNGNQILEREWAERRAGVAAHNARMEEKYGKKLTGPEAVAAHNAKMEEKYGKQISGPEAVAAHNAKMKEKYGEQVSGPEAVKAHNERVRAAEAARLAQLKNAEPTEIDKAILEARKSRDVAKQGTDIDKAIAEKRAEQAAMANKPREMTEIDKSIIESRKNRGQLTEIDLAIQAARQQKALVKGFATGGLVPGTGSGDTVPALLEPGELVVPRRQVKKFASGGMVGGIQGFANGGMAQGGPELLDVAAKFNQAATQISQGLSGFSTSVSTFNGAVANFGTFVDKFDEAVGKIPGQIELSGANEISVNLMGQDSIVKAVTEAIGPMIAEAIRANQPVEQRSQ